MTNRQAITVLKKIITVADKSSSGIKEIDGTDEEAIQVAIKALEKEPSGDLISREDVEECKELMTDINGDTVYAVRMSDIRQLSPVNPHLEHGEWISEKVDGEDWKGCKRQYYQPISCSKCHSPNHYKSAYCPNCGAKMVKPQERSDKK